ncbi:MAG: ATP-grasp domain-containing protein [Parcubacteria group bacterium]|jgi:D-alanine-D-alanine ligase-like ATP-grasp enzyme
MIKNPPLIKKVVEEMGGTFEEVIPERGCYNIHVRGKVFLITRKFRIAKNFISIAGATTHKDLTYTLLKRRSLPTPTTVFFFRKNFQTEDAEKKIASLNFPIIIKDASGSNSQGIFPYIKTPKEAQSILKKEIVNFRSLIAQEMIFGKEYRVLMLDEKVIGALEMIPPRVFGNGCSTIQELIEEKQKSTHRKTPIDTTLEKILQEQGFSFDHILGVGEIASIKKSSSLAEGGETRDVTELVNKKIVSICAKAADAIGDYLAGIDIICEDISADPKGQTFGILEINGKPDIYIHYNPTFGKSRNVIKDIINFILKLSTTQKSNLSKNKDC